MGLPDRGYLLPAAVLVGEMTTAAALRGAALPAALYVVAIGLTLLVSRRRPAAAFVLALVVAAVSGAAYLLLLWTAFRAGRSARATVVTLGAAVGGLGVPVVRALAEPGTASQGLVMYLVFVALPLVAGRYLSQHARLVAALSERNRELRRAQHLLADRERLRERLRIAREMHDALGHRLALVSVQAAALEVSDLRTAHRQAVGQLAGSARDALDGLHDVVAALRQGDEIEGPGLDDLDALVEEWARAGVPVTLDRRRRGAPLTRDVDRTAYRVVEEGVTNATRHAPASPVTVTLEEEADTLLITVANPLGGTAGSGGSGGSGLTGLRERVEGLGGYASLLRGDGDARLVVLLPTSAEPLDEPVDEPSAPPARRLTVAYGAATAVLLFGVLPAAMMVGAG